MKFVPSDTAPQELKEWIRQRKAASSPQRVHFDELNNVEIAGVNHDAKGATLAALIRDQGHICPYTLVSIQAAGRLPNGFPIAATAHIEHIIPRSISNEQGNPEQTVDYDNLLACYPKHPKITDDITDGDPAKDGVIKFGAHARGNALLVVTPRDSDCEACFDYRDDGTVHAAANPPGNRPYAEVDKLVNQTLKLNDSALMRVRLAALRDTGLTVDTLNPIESPDDAEFIAQGIVAKDAQNRHKPFCIAIAQVAMAYAVRLRAAMAGGIT